MKTLVDTSVWSLAFRHSNQADHPAVAELGRLVRDHRVLVIGPVRQEVLSGIRAEFQFLALERRMSAFPDLAISGADYVMAARFFNLCRARGVQGSNTDFLLCSVSVRHNISIFTADTDFVLYAKHLPLQLHSLHG